MLAWLAQSLGWRGAQTARPPDAVPSDAHSGARQGGGATGPRGRRFASVVWRVGPSGRGGALLSLLIAALAGAGCGGPAATPGSPTTTSGGGRAGVAQAEAEVCLRGRATAEGIECQAFRAADGRLYTLVGDLGGLGARHGSRGLRLRAAGRDVDLHAGHDAHRQPDRSARPLPMRRFARTAGGGPTGMSPMGPARRCCARFRCCGYSPLASTKSSPWGWPLVFEKVEPVGCRLRRAQQRTRAHR